MKNETEKAIFKLNGGNGALLCNKCRAIIKTGSNFTELEWAASKGLTHLAPQFCDKCKKQQTKKK